MQHHSAAYYLFPEVSFDGVKDKFQICDTVFRNVTHYNMLSFKKKKIHMLLSMVCMCRDASFLFIFQ